MLIRQNKFRKSVFVNHSAKVAEPSNNSARNHAHEVENGIHWNVQRRPGDAITGPK